MNPKKTSFMGLVSAFFLFMLLLAAPVLHAAVPLELNYQGFLGDSVGDPVQDGSYAMSFAIYNAPTGGAVVWSEAQTVAVTNGVYSVILGTVSLIDPLDMEGDLYLGVTVGSDPEMTPRQKLTSAAFSIHAAQADEADTLDGLDSTAFADAAHTHSGNDITSGTVNAAYIDPNIARDAEITWSNLSGIPADIADGDDVGIAAESDPTVIASVKDGVSWGELSGVPAGFADGVDNDSGGDITSVTAGTGLSGGGASGSVTLNVDIPLSLTGSASGQGVINASNDDSMGYGVYGEATGSTGRGVQGIASNSGSVANCGGYFRAEGSDGRGVYGSAPGNDGRGVQGIATGTNGIGAYCAATGSTGRGVYGRASNLGNGPSYGGYFEALGTEGRGVYSEASGAGAVSVYGYASYNGSGYNHGGLFIAASTNGRGVRGVADNAGSGTNYGGYFLARGSAGRGVSGHASNTDSGAANYGGYFEAEGGNGMGVYAHASGTNGIGVYGEATNTESVTNYGGYFQADGSDSRGIYGEATGSDASGVYGRASGIRGRGVYAYATGTNGRGVYGYASGANGIGVYGLGGDWDFYAGSGSAGYGPFTGGHEVKFIQDFPENIRPGMIVSVCGKAGKRVNDDGEISLSSTLPTVTIAQKPMDKAVFGVLVSEGPLPEDHWYEAQEGERFGVVNALGEGRVWVTDINGEIQAGDYITTSMIPGYGRLQDDDLLHAYTLGKAIESVDWDEVSEVVEIDGKTYRAYLIAVVYTSG